MQSIVQRYCSLINFTHCIWNRSLLLRINELLQILKCKQDLMNKLKYAIKFAIFYKGGSWLFLDDRWKLPSPTPPRVDYFFIVFFLLSNFIGDQWFLLLFTFFWWENFHFWSFSLHSRVPVFLFLCFTSMCVSVCVGGVSVGRRGGLPLILDGSWLFLDDRLYRPARPIPRVLYFFIVFFAV